MHVRVSRRPYTAMCLDIFEDQTSLSISKYINDKGLSGDYTIFISINDQLYKTDKLVIAEFCIVAYKGCL